MQYSVIAMKYTREILCNKQELALLVPENGIQGIYLLST